MLIGELAERAGTTARALRYYEECGLLEPSRTPSGYRSYEERTVKLVRRIQILLAAGLSSSTIAEILPCVTSDEVVLEGKCQELLDGLARERQRITAQMAALGEARDILDGLVGRPL